LWNSETISFEKLRTDGFAVVDLDGGIRLFRGERLHTLTLRVENLLDTEYREHLSRTKAIMPEPGRNISLLYRLSF
jgi:iron complex outermembrane receptor protein